METSIVSKYRNEIYGLSILWIVLFHGNAMYKAKYFAEIPVLKELSLIINNGNMGVEIFMFLSGICLYYSMKKNPDAKSFIKRRMVRIFLPLWIICGPYWVYQMVIGKLGILNFLLYMTGLRFWVDGDQQTWFVSLIMVCYLMYPYFFKLFDTDKKKAKIRMYIAVGLSIYITLLMKYYMVWFYGGGANGVGSKEIAISRFPVFIIGCWAGRYIYEKKKLNKRAWLWMILAVIACFAVLKMNTLHGLTRRYWYMVGGIPLAFITAKVMQYLGRYIRWIFAFLGGISLEIYLAHVYMAYLSYRDKVIFADKRGSVKYWLVLALIAIVIAYAGSLVEKLIKRCTPAKKTTKIEVKK